MASLTQEKNGTRKILFLCPETGKRKSIRLGKIPKKLAESIKIRVEELIQYQVLGVPYTADFAQWLNHIERPLYRQFVKVGLLKDKIELTLGEFLGTYVENNRHRVEESTVLTWQNPIRNLKKFFGEDMPIHKITQEQVTAWERWLREAENLKPITISRRIGQVKQFFHEAVRLEYLPKNPFECLKRFSVNGDDGEGIVEHGTESAVFTEIGYASLGSEPPKFIAGHPFLFLIRERKSGTILFLGRVMDPTRN